MILTSNSDIFGGFKESAFNTIIREIMEQRPKEFNYASHDVAKFKSFCSPIKVNPVLESMGIEKCTIVEKLPIIGLNNPSVGVDFCVQLKEFKVDFQPSNQIALPVELGSLVLQEFSLKGTVCAGINCGGTIGRKKTDKKLSEIELNGSRGISFLPFDKLNMMCFCISLYAKVVLIREGNDLQLRLVGVELEDISPLGLENSIECYLKQMLDSVVFPKMKLAIGDLVFSAGSYFTLGLTPVSPAVPFNPGISNDQLSIFINLI